MRLKLILLCIFLSSCVVAQIADKKGSIELLNGTRTRGMISYYEIQQKDFHVRDSNGLRHIYPPALVKNVMLDNGEKYITYSLASETTTSYLILQSLIESEEISLFRKLKSGHPEFYVLKEGQLYFLQNDKIMASRDSLQTDKHKYIRTLIHLMADKPGFDKKAENIRLHETGLTRLISAYNNGISSYCRKPKSRSYWSVFGQFSGYSYINTHNPTPGKSVSSGIQYNFTQSLRSALKLSFDYRYFHDSYSDLSSYNMAVIYAFAILNEEHYSLYVLANITDLSYFLYTDPENDHINYTHIAFRPHLHPGICLEITPGKRFSPFVEYNGLSNLEKYDYNFSFGLKYKFMRK